MTDKKKEIAQLIENNVSLHKSSMEAYNRIQSKFPVIQFTKAKFAEELISDNDVNLFVKGFQVRMETGDKFKWENRRIYRHDRIKGRFEVVNDLATLYTVVEKLYSDWNTTVLHLNRRVKMFAPTVKSYLKELEEFLRLCIHSRDELKSKSESESKEFGLYRHGISFGGYFPKHIDCVDFYVRELGKSDWVSSPSLHIEVDFSAEVSEFFDSFYKGLSVKDEKIKNKREKVNSILAPIRVVRAL